MNGAGEMLVFSAADFEDFLEPRPDLPPDAGSANCTDVVTAAGREPLAVPPARHLRRVDRAGSSTSSRRSNRDVPFDGLHWFFDHAETITDRNIERIKALGGGIAVQHRMAFQGEYFVDRYGADGGRAHARRSPGCWQMGVPVGAGTDATRVASYNPWVSLYWLVTGQDRRRHRRSTPRRTGWTGRRRCGCTPWAARGSPARRTTKGAIEVGQLGRPRRAVGGLLRGPRGARSSGSSRSLTVVGGKVVYAAGDFRRTRPAAAAGQPGLVAGEGVRRLPQSRRRGGEAAPNARPSQPGPRPAAPVHGRGRWSRPRCLGAGVRVFRVLGRPDGHVGPAGPGAASPSGRATCSDPSYTRTHTMIHAYTRLAVVASALAASLAAFAADPAGAVKEATVPAPNGVTLKVRMEGPYTADVPLQVVCYFRYTEAGAKRMAGGTVELDQRLGGVIAALRGRGEFKGAELETLLITPPAGSIKAKALLLVGLGDEDRLSLETAERVGSVAMREAARLGVGRVGFAPLIRDQGNTKLGTGEVETAVTRGVLLAYDTERRLPEEGLAKPVRAGRSGGWGPDRGASTRRSRGCGRRPPRLPTPSRAGPGRRIRLRASDRPDLRRRRDHRPQSERHGDGRDVRHPPRRAERVRVGPGGPGSLPTQGSHRPVRARIRAYGSSDHGFAACL